MFHPAEQALNDHLAIAQNGSLIVRKLRTCGDVSQSRKERAHGIVLAHKRAYHVTDNIAGQAL